MPYLNLQVATATLDCFAHLGGNPGPALYEWTRCQEPAGHVPRFGVMAKQLTRLIKPSIHHRSIFTAICTGMDLLAYDNDAPGNQIVQELRGIINHGEGLLAEKLSEAVTGKKFPPPKRIQKRIQSKAKARKKKQLKPA